ncbi:MAG: hypothetical protein AB8G99_22725, partial [Planctomycetaceae bacterium]
MRWKQYLDAASKWLTSAQFTSILQAVAAGVGLIFGVSLAIGTVGFSVWAVAGLLLAAAVGLDVAWRSAPVSSHIRTLFKVSLVAWIFLAPALADAAFSLSGALLRTAAASTMGSVVTGLLVGLVTLAMPGFLVGLSIAQSNRFSVRSLFGIALGIAFAPLLPIATLGAQSLALLTAAVAAVFEIARAILGRDSEFEITQANKNASSAYATLLSYFGILTAGASIAILARVLNQTMPASLQAMAWGMAAVLAGTVIGYRRSQRNASALPVCYALLAISLSSAFLLFPQIVQTQLAVNAKVSIAPAVFALRGLLTALIMLPAGLVVGCSLSRLKSANGGFPSPGMTAVCGLVAAWFICPVVGSSVLAMMLIAVVGVLTVASVRASSVHWVPKSTAGWTAVVLAVVAAIATPFGVNRFDTELSSQLLFSSAVFREYANGTESHLLLATNDGRRLSTYESADGVSSAWRYAGTRIQVRQNGIPVSVTSTDVSTCPQSASAIMPVVLPLLLHESAENILLLGDVGPAAEATSLMFPITSVTTLGRETRTSDEVDQHFKARHADDRFTKV